MKNGFFWQLATIGFVARPELEATQHFLKFHKKKVRVIDWWSMAGLIHHSFLNPGDIITAEKYCHQIEILLRNTRKTATFISNIGQQKWFYPFPTTIPDHMSPDLQRNEMKRTTKFYLIHHTRQISLPPIIFSSISISSCVKNASNPREMLKRHSTTLLLSGLQNFIQLELQLLLDVHWLQCSLFWLIKFCLSWDMYM